jgi:pyruvate/2-oxoglutarate dehydrogenase complex dihydrolipoamide dehydrogenase (E3) component
MAAYDYDYFVIGAGSGGVRSSRIAATHLGAAGKVAVAGMSARVKGGAT